MGQMKKIAPVNKKVVSLLFNFAIVITIIFYSKFQDPFNSPKFWILLLSASWLLGYLIQSKVELNRSDKSFYKKLILIVVVYLISLLISSFLSYNRNVSFLGETFRRNGSLTYIGFTIFFLSAAKFIRFENIKIGFNRVIFVGFLTSAYAFIQLSGNDFVQWTEKTSVITTLGNSNFAGASMAIILVSIFGQIFIKSLSIYNRIILIVVSVMLFLAILPTNARQALIILFFGLFLITLYKIYEFNKKLGHLAALVGSATAMLAVLGTLQIGPLSDLLYKQSISVRGFYWRAGISMFKEYPLFGVGVDNYGAFFKQYRDVQYSLNYGFGITSSAAHNVFIQNFATGGIFVGVFYLLLQILVAYKGINLLRNNQGDKRLISVIVFVSWLAFQAQSLISIDNVGVSIWGWIFGGAIIGLSFSESTESNVTSRTKKSSIEINWQRLIVSNVAILLSLLLIVPLYNGERYTWLARAYYDPNSNDIKIQEQFKKYSNQALKSKFINNDYKNIILSNLYSVDQSTAIEQLSQINRYDYRNLDTLSLLAGGNEFTGNFTEAIKIRKEIAKYDPWNALNYLSLGILYKNMNDSENMELMLAKIQSFASADPIARQASEQLVLKSK
jgi:O-antigen ligase